MRKSELIKLKNQLYKDGNDISLIKFDASISDKKNFEIQEQQDLLFRKYHFLCGLSKAMDKNKEKQQEELKEETDFEDCFICQNCREMYPLENMGTSELARQDQICEFCMENGYGK